VSSAYPYCARLVAGTGGFRFAGSPDHAWPSEGEFGSVSTPSDPAELKSPAKGAGMPPKLSHGEPAFRSASRCCASAFVIG
jgi:hypothetical protein